MHFYFSLQSSFSQTIFRHLLVGEKRGSSIGESRHKFMNVRLSESSFTRWSKKYQYHFCILNFEFPEHLRMRWKSWMNEGRGKAEGTSPDSVMSRFYCLTVRLSQDFYFSIFSQDFYIPTFPAISSMVFWPAVQSPKAFIFIRLS